MRRVLSLFTRLKTTINSYRGDTWILRGMEKHCGEEITLLYVGSEVNRNYVAGLIYGDSYDMEYHGKNWIWSTIRKKGNSSDLSIRELPFVAQNIFRNKRSFIVPTWVNQTMDLSIDLDSWISKDRTLAHDRRKIKKYDLHPVITKDPGSFDNFYHFMYLPYMTKRFGNKASISEYALLKRLMESGELLFVNQGQESIAGMLIDYEGGVPRLLVLGIKDADPTFISQGAGGAAYQFAIQYIKERGYTFLSLGSTRAFINDGVLQHKEKWGIKVSNSKNVVFQLCPQSLNSGVKSFLVNNPFMCIHAAKLTETIFTGSGNSLDSSEIDDIFRKYQLNGVKTLRVCRFSKGHVIEEHSRSCEE
jgi:hypothetical protein